MNFSFIDERIDGINIRYATARFNRTMIELAVRKDNLSVGTGLGGNNFQLLTLMSFNHCLINSEENLTVKGDDLLWGVDFFLSSNKDIRQGIDKGMLLIPEKCKYIAAALNDENDPKPMRSKIMRNHDQFPNLIRAMNGRDYKFDKSLSYIERYLFASVMCQELSAYLDEGDKSTVQAIGAALEFYPKEIVLMAFRKYVGIHRMIYHNLDEDPVMNKVLYAITRSLDG